jgi:hypothetical protein
MTKAAINPRNVPMDLHRGSSREVTSDVGQHASVEDGSVSQQAVEDESVSQQASATAGAGAGAGAQHVDSGSSINLISLVMIFPSIIFDL